MFTQVSQGFGTSCLDRVDVTYKTMCAVLGFKVPVRGDQDFNDDPGKVSASFSALMNGKKVAAWVYTPSKAWIGKNQAGSWSIWAEDKTTLLKFKDALNKA